MPTITLSDACDSKLKTLALAARDPFTTRESLIERLIDDAIARNGFAANGNSGGHGPTGDRMVLDPDRHEDLDHTRVISANVNGRELFKPKWNSVFNTVHTVAWNNQKTFEGVKRLSPANLRKGQYEGEGYKPLPDTDISIQGVSANLAWEHSLTVAKALNIPIRVEFEWRDKDGAAHPGQRGVLEWKPAAP